MDVTAGRFVFQREGHFVPFFHSQASERLQTARGLIRKIWLIALCPVSTQARPKMGHAAFSWVSNRLKLAPQGLDWGFIHASVAYSKKHTELQSRQAGFRYGDFNARRCRLLSAVRPYRPAHIDQHGASGHPLTAARRTRWAHDICLQIQDEAQSSRH